MWIFSSFNLGKIFWNPLLDTKKYFEDQACTEHKSDKSDVLGELISTYSAPISALDCLIQVSYKNKNCSQVSNTYIFITFRLQEHPQTDLGCCSVLKVEADILNSDYSSLGNSLSGLASLKHVRIEKFKKIHPTTIYGRQYSVVTSTLYPRFH